MNRRIKIKKFKLYFSFVLLLTASKVFANLELIEPAFLGPPLSSTTTVMQWQNVSEAPLVATWVYVGTDEEGPGQYNIYNSKLLAGLLSEQTASAVISGIPITGSPVFVTLWWRETQTSGWDSFQYVLETEELDIATPKIDSVIADDEVGYQISWESNNIPVQKWWVNTGPQPLSGGYVNTGVLPAEQMEYTESGGFFNTPFPVVTYSTLWYLETGSPAWQNVSKVGNVGGSVTTNSILRFVNEQPVPELGDDFVGFVSGDNPVLELLEPTMEQVVELWVYMGLTPFAEDNGLYDSGSITPVGGGPVVLQTDANLPEDFETEFYITVWYRVDASTGVPNPAKWFRQTHRYISVSGMEF